MHNWRTSADKDFWQKTWRLAIPVSMQSMLFAILGLVDVMMVSKLGRHRWPLSVWVTEFSFLTCC